MPHGVPVFKPTERLRRVATPAETRRNEYAYLYGRRWKRARLWFLAEHPLCRDCEAEGRQEGATEVHHEPKHGGDAVAFWDTARWVGLCKRHHDTRTGRGE